MCELGSMLFLPPALIARAGGEEYIRKQWRVTPKVYDESEPAEPVDPCVLRKDGWLGIPPNAGYVWLAENFPATEIADMREMGAPMKVSKRPVPRPGQEECFFNVHSAVRDSGYATFIQTTGGGKTVVALDVAANLGRRTLVIVPSKTLADQWRERAMEHLGMTAQEIGIASGGMWPKEKSIVIAVIHNLVMDTAFIPLGYLQQFGTCITDECLPAGTLVDGRRIENLRIGDYVNSVGATGVERKRVTFIWKRPLKQRLLRIRFSREDEIVCTENHLIWVQGKGFIPAKDLHRGCVAVILQHEPNTEHCLQNLPDRSPLSDTEVTSRPQKRKRLLLPSPRSARAARGPREEASNGGASLSSLREAGDSSFEKREASLLQRGGLLQRRTRGGLQEEGGAGQHEEVAARQQGVSQKKNEGTQPYAHAGHTEQSDGHPDSYWPQACDTGRKRNWLNQAAVGLARIASWLGSRVCGKNRRAASGYAESLQNRFSKQAKKDRSRDRWREPQFFSQERSGCSKDSSLGITRVESVEILEPDGFGRYPQHCPEAFVYDIEVEGNHNFFANNVLVHNCHRVGAALFSRAMGLIPAAYRIGLTATPRRKDGCWRLIQDHFGSDAVEAQGESLEMHCYGIESSFIMPPGIQKAPFAIQMKYLSKHRGRNKIVIDTALELYRRGRRFVIMSTNVEQLQTLQTELAGKGVNAKETGFYTGFTYRTLNVAKGEKLKKIPVLEKTRRELRESTTHRIIFGTYAQMKEGVDIPWLDAGIDAMPLADGVQMAGRPRRYQKGKLTPCWFTLVDVNIPRLKAFAKARLRGMEEAGITIHYQL